MANTVYSNKVIEAKATDLLTTGVDARTLMTVDTSLTAEAGMIKTINTYTYNGAAEELEAGEGNTTRGSVAYVGKDYPVKLVQQAFDYTDEDFMKDNLVVDMGVQGATQVMTNKMTADFIAALETENEGTRLITNVETFAKDGELSYDVIVDAISKINVEDESKLVVLIPNAWKAGLRKDPDYVSARMGEVVYNGQVGTVAGLPVVATKALIDEAYVLSPEAVKCFMKKDVEVEQDRNADTRTNSIYLRNAYVVALVDATKACRIAEANA